MTQDERINAISVNPHMATIDDIADLAATVQEQRERIAELEAANQWHPASDPPEDGRTVRCAVFRDCVWNNGFEDALGFDFDADFWRDLPPMGKESR